MDEFPVVKGWTPYKSVAADIIKKDNEIKKKKDREQYQSNANESNLVDVPKDWKTPAFNIEDNPHKRLFAETEFRVKFPSALTKYLKEVFPIAQKAFAGHHVKSQLILNDGFMTVGTTRKTFDPVIILKAHGVIKLLARYVPVEDAITVLEDDVFEDIIDIGHNKKETFQRRRNHLSDKSIMDLIKELLDCKVFICGKTVSAIGSYSNLDKLRGIVSDFFVKNIHPIYNLKRLQGINRLQSMPDMAGKDWSAYLPAIPKKKNVKRVKPHKIRETKEYCAFPPAPVDSKIDKELAAGTFHLKYEKQRNKKYFSLVDKAKEKEEEKQKKKEEDKKNKEEELKKKSESTDNAVTKRKRTDDNKHEEPKPKKMKK